jgi:hypothetical protein
MTDIEARLTSLEERVEFLEGGRSGRKPRPVVVSEKGVCGLDPSRDSASCPEASIYRRQRGCLGTACRRKYDEYYANYRAKDDSADERRT